MDIILIMPNEPKWWKMRLIRFCKKFASFREKKKSIMIKKNFLSWNEQQFIKKKKKPQTILMPFNCIMKNTNDKVWMWMSMSVNFIQKKKTYLHSLIQQ